MSQFPHKNVFVNRYCFRTKVNLSITFIHEIDNCCSLLSLKILAKVERYCLRQKADDKREQMAVSVKPHEGWILMPLHPIIADFHFLLVVRFMVEQLPIEVNSLDAN